MRTLTYVSKSCYTCPYCDREFSVWKMRRFSGWSTAHHLPQTENLNKANAERHLKACARKHDDS